jgi:hypothetical protein
VDDVSAPAYGLEAIPAESRDLRSGSTMRRLRTGLNAWTKRASGDSR